MPLSVRLDAKTEALIGRLAKRRKQSKSEVIRDAIGVLTEQQDKRNGSQRPYDLVAHLIGCVQGGHGICPCARGRSFAKSSSLGKANADDLGRHRPTRRYNP